MIDENITRPLPEGVGQLLLSRLLAGPEATGWVRAGELTRVGDDLELATPWDGEAFAILWEAARRSDRAATTPRVEFAVLTADGLRRLGGAPLTRDLTRRVRWGVR